MKKEGKTEKMEKIKKTGKMENMENIDKMGKTKKMGKIEKNSKETNKQNDTSEANGSESADERILLEEARIAFAKTFNKMKEGDKKEIFCPYMYFFYVLKIYKNMMTKRFKKKSDRRSQEIYKHLYSVYLNLGRCYFMFLNSLVAYHISEMIEKKENILEIENYPTKKTKRSIYCKKSDLLNKLFVNFSLCSLSSYADSFCVSCLRNESAFAPKKSIRKKVSRRKEDKARKINDITNKTHTKNKIETKNKIDTKNKTKTKNKTESKNKIVTKNKIETKNKTETKNKGEENDTGKTKDSGMLKNIDKMKYKEKNTKTENRKSTEKAKNIEKVKNKNKEKLNAVEVGTETIRNQNITSKKKSTSHVSFTKPSFLNIKCYTECLKRTTEKDKKFRWVPNMIESLYKLLTTRLKICLYYPEYFFIACIHNYNLSTTQPNRILKVIRSKFFCRNSDSGVIYLIKKSRWGTANLKELQNSSDSDEGWNNSIQKKEGQNSPHFKKNSIAKKMDKRNIEYPGGLGAVHMKKKKYLCCFNYYKNRKEWLDLKNYEMICFDHIHEETEKYHQMETNSQSEPINKKGKEEYATGIDSPVNNLEPTCEKKKKKRKKKKNVGTILINQWKNAGYDAKKDDRKIEKIFRRQRKLLRKLKNKMNPCFNACSFKIDPEKLSVIINNTIILYRDIIKDILEGLYRIAENETNKHYSMMASFYICYYFVKTGRYDRCLKPFQTFIQNELWKQKWKQEQTTSVTRSLFNYMQKKYDFHIIKFITVILEHGKRVLCDTMKKICKKREEEKESKDSPALMRKELLTDTVVEAHRHILIACQCIRREPNISNETGIELKKQKLLQNGTNEIITEDSGIPVFTCSYEADDITVTSEEKIKNRNSNEIDKESQSPNEKQMIDNREHVNDLSKGNENENELEKDKENMNTINDSPNANNKRKMVRERKRVHEPAAEGNTLQKKGSDAAQRHSHSQVEEHWEFLGYSSLSHLNSIHSFLVILFDIYTQLSSLYKRHCKYETLEAATKHCPGNFSIISVLLDEVAHHLLFHFEVLIYFTSDLLIYPTLILFCEPEKFEKLWTHGTNKELLISHNKETHSVDLRILKVFRDFYNMKPFQTYKNLMTNMEVIYESLLSKFFYFELSDEEIQNILKDNSGVENPQTTLQYLEKVINTDNKLKLSNFLNHFDTETRMQFDFFLKSEDLRQLSGMIQKNIESSLYSIGRDQNEGKTKKNELTINSRVSKRRRETLRTNKDMNMNDTSNQDISVNLESSSTDKYEHLSANSSEPFIPLKKIYFSENIINTCAQDPVDWGKHELLCYVKLGNGKIICLSNNFCLFKNMKYLFKRKGERKRGAGANVAVPIATRKRKKENVLDEFFHKQEDVKTRKRRKL